MNFCAGVKISPHFQGPLGPATGEKKNRAITFHVSPCLYILYISYCWDWNRTKKIHGQFGTFWVPSQIFVGCWSSNPPYFDPCFCDSSVWNIKPFKKQNYTNWNFISFWHFTETHSLKEPHQVESLQDQAQVMLGDYVRHAYPSRPVRFGRLLLTLPALRAVSSKLIERLFFQETIGSIPIERLLSDMFQSSWSQNYSNTYIPCLVYGYLLPTLPALRAVNSKLIKRLSFQETIDSIPSDMFQSS